MPPQQYWMRNAFVHGHFRCLEHFVMLGFCENHTLGRSRGAGGDVSREGAVIA